MRVKQGVAAALAVAVAALAGCTTEPDDLDTDTYTAVAVEIAWDEQSMYDKQAMCEGIETLGLEWAADVMREGFTGDARSLNADLAAVLVSVKCDEEGY